MLPLLYQRAPGLLLLALLGLVIAPVAGADTAADVTKVNSFVQRAESNLQSVDASIGQRTSPPAGSAGKLATSRLKQAYEDLAPAGQLLRTLPADGAGVAEALTRYGNAVALYQKLAAIMNGGNAPAANPESAGGTKLGYPHADNLKTALSTLREVEGYVNALVQLHAEYVGITDQTQLSQRKTAQAVNTISDARTKAGYVEKGLAPIPADGQGVPEAKERLAAARQALDGAEQFFVPLNQKLTAQIDPANFPEFPQDLKWLGDTNNAYRNSTVYLNDTPRMAELSGQRQEAQAELVRIAQKYRAMIEQNTPQGQQIENYGNAALGAFQKFDAEAEQTRLRLPGEIREHLQDAVDTAEMAVAEEKPGYFTGGIPQIMGWAQDKLALLVAIGETEETQALQQEYDATQSRLNESARSLEGLIIQTNQPPADNYAGDDRDEVIAMAIDGWKVQQPDAEVVAVRMPVKQWKRETKWVFWRGEASKYDKSTLQVRLFVADPEKPDLLIDRPINVRKDHLADDSLMGIPLDDFELTPLQPADYYLREKLK